MSLGFDGQDGNGLQIEKIEGPSFTRVLSKNDREPIMLCFPLERIIYISF